MSKDARYRADCQQRVWEQVGDGMRNALTEVLQAFMEHERDLMLAAAPYQRTGARRGYRNGYDPRWLDTGFGPVRLRKPKVRGCARPFRTLVFDLYQRRARKLEDCVQRLVGGGLATRGASAALSHAFGVDLSAGGVSAVMARLDEEVRAFHSRPLVHGYRYVFFDGKWGYTCHRRRRRGRGRKRQGVMLLAWGIRHDGREELIDFRAADREDERSWTDFLTDLERRGLRVRNPWNQTLDMITTDAGGGLLAALYTVYPDTPKQRCVFHKVEDITEHLKDRTHRKAILREAGAIYDGLKTPHQARARLARWARRWEECEPDAVRTFCYDFEQTLTYLNAPEAWRSRVKTSNPIERFIRELDRKFERVGIFPSSASWERCAWSVWNNLKTDGYAPTTRQPTSEPFTRNS